VIITCLFTVLLASYVIYIVKFVPFLWVKIAGVLAVLALIVTAIYVLFERVNEIRSGEEDDLGNY
jgi:hypothetical protein